MADFMTLTSVVDGIEMIALSPDGGRLAFKHSRDWVVRVWDLADRVELTTWENPQPVGAMGFGGDGRTLYVAVGKAVEAWDTDAEKKAGELPGADEGYVAGIAASPDGTLLATTGSDYAVSVWDAATRERKHRLETGVGMFGVAFSADGKTLGACGGSGKIALYLAARGKAKAAPGPLGGDGSLRRLAFSPDGNSLVVVGDSIRSIDLVTGVDRIGFTPPAPEAMNVAFSPDGARLVFGAKRRLVVAEAATGGVVREIDVGSGLSAMAVSADRARVVTGDANGTVCVWDAAKVFG